jgi:hypothetical protein
MLERWRGGPWWRWYLAVVAVAVVLRVISDVTIAATRPPSVVQWLLDMLVVLVPILLLVWAPRGSSSFVMRRRAERRFANGPWLWIAAVGMATLVIGLIAGAAFGAGAVGVTLTTVGGVCLLVGGICPWILTLLSDEQSTGGAAR